MANHFTINLFSRNIVSRYDIYNADTNNLVVISLFHSNTLGLSKGDKVIFLHKNRNNYFFSSYGIIEQIGSPGETNREKYMISKIEISIKGILSGEYTLNDFVYSLLKISRYNKPYLHFNWPYNKLKKFDYDTLTNERIFLSRTIFGKIINKLTIEHKIDYLNLCFAELGDDYFNGHSLKKALEILRNYINYTIVTPGRYIEKTTNLISNIIPEEYKNKIGFMGDYENEIPDNIFEQNKLFKELLKYEKRAQFWIYFDELLAEEQQVESSFINEFQKRKKRWPIIL